MATLHEDEQSDGNLSSRHVESVDHEQLTVATGFSHLQISPYACDNLKGYFIKHRLAFVLSYSVRGI